MFVLILKFWHDPCSNFFAHETFCQFLYYSVARYYVAKMKNRAKTPVSTTRYRPLIICYLLKILKDENTYK